MLGSAPGTDLLNEWVAAVNDGSSLQDIADHIAASDAFTTTYPTFLTNAEFAESFLANLMGSEEVPAALVTAAEGIVTGLLNDGMTRGALAIAVFTAMYEIHDQGEAHSAYADLGMVANGLFNKIDVAEYYTVDLRQANPNSRVLRDVNSEMGLDDIQDSIGDYLDPPDPILLTSQRDNVVGTAANDLIVAEPDSRGEDTLDPFDVIDGGPGHDSLEVYASGTEDIEIDTNGADVTNVERVYLSTRGAIDVDLSGWEGLETVELGRFGSDANVSVTVDGASVSTTRTYGGETAMISGASGMVSAEAGGDTAVTIGSGAHTNGVSVKGGSMVTVHNGAGGQSMTVTNVYIDGVQRNLGADGARGDNVDVKPVTIMSGNGAGTTSTVYVTVASDGTKTDVDETATGFEQNYYKAAIQDANGETDGTGLDADEVIVTQNKAMAEGYDAGGGDMPSVKIHSDAIEHVSLSNNDAIVAVINESDEAEDLMVTVNKYGGTTDNPVGKLCIKGDGSAENVSIMVAGDSNFALASDEVKSISVTGEGGLTLDINKFDNETASSTLESITLSGSGKFTSDVAGMGKLASIDASASSGTNSLTGVGGAVASVSGGSGSDSVMVGMLNTKGLAVDLGAGNDTYTASEGNDKSRIDGGEGRDVLALSGGGAVTYKGDDGKAKSIYSNFEVLDVGGGSGSYNIALLGVEDVQISSSNAINNNDTPDDLTDDSPFAITLAGMSDGMDISVTAGMAGRTTDATLHHTMPGRDPGDPRYSGELDVSLHARGGAMDTKAMGGQSGLANLTLTVDEEIETLNIDSSASAGGSMTTPATNRPSASNYNNMLTLNLERNAADDGDLPATVEAIVVSGNAKLTLQGAAFAELELLDASDNSGGVTFNGNDPDGDGTASPLTQALELIGGSGGDTLTAGDAATGTSMLIGNGGIDTLTGGSGADVLRGGAGMDTLDGGGAGDRYIIADASESSLIFSADGKMSGFDTIATDGLGGDDRIALPKSLRDSFQGTIKSAETLAGNGSPTAGLEGFTVNSTDTADPDTTPNTLRALIGDGDGFFETRTGDGGFGGSINRHSVAVVREQHDAVPDNPDTDADESREAVDNTWIFIDVDGDGDFDAGEDIAIRVMGNTASTIDAETFVAMSG